MNAFRPGLQRILEQAAAPVVPMALRGLWGSLFSRSDEGKTLRGFRGLLSRISLVVGPAIAPERATPEALYERVAVLRGDAR